MVAGLPGTGIGGMFYLMSAFLMPFKELIKTFRGHSNKRRWKLVGSQTGLALGIMGGFWITGFLLDFMLRGVIQNNINTLPHFLRKIFMVKSMALSIITLSSVLIGMEMVDIIIRKKLLSLRPKNSF